MISTDIQCLHDSVIPPFSAPNGSPSQNLTKTKKYSEFEMDEQMKTNGLSK